MKKGFTILELLVASLLLAMLVTVLTSIFNQSAIAWRTGTAGVADLDAVRNTMAQVRDEADNAFVHNEKVYSLTGLWDDNGVFRKRACDADETPRATILQNQIAIDSQTDRPVLWKNGKNTLSVGSGERSSASKKTYTVNVKSAGPDRVFNTYDDIWSFPDEFDL